MSFLNFLSFPPLSKKLNGFCISYRASLRPPKDYTCFNSISLVSDEYANQWGRYTCDRCKGQCGEKVLLNRVDQIRNNEKLWIGINCLFVHLCQRRFSKNNLEKNIHRNGCFLLLFLPLVWEWTAGTAERNCAGSQNMERPQAYRYAVWKYAVHGHPNFYFSNIFLFHIARPHLLCWMWCS